jgi:hypothetical protein
MWALAESQFDGPITLGLVGPADARQQVRRTFEHVFPLHAVIEADEGWEQVTLNAIPGMLEADGAVLYAHTKGAGHPNRHQERWRQAMTFQVVRHWQAALAHLADHAVVGCHWLEPGNPLIHVPGPMPAGNFWMATCAYLRKLPVCGQAARHDAELWIGQGAPSVFDLLPGVPPQPSGTVGRLVVPLDL